MANLASPGGESSERGATDPLYDVPDRDPVRDAIVLRGIQTASDVAQAVPWPVWRVLTLAAALLTMLLSPNRRRIAWKSVRHVRGGRTSPPVRWWLGAQQVASHFRVVVATLRLGGTPDDWDQSFAIEGLDRIRPHLGQQGIIVVAPHAGPYTVIGLLARVWLRDTGFTGEFAVVARMFRPFRSGALMDWFVERYGRSGVEIIPVHADASAIAGRLRAVLENKGVVVLVVDEPTPTPSLPTRFFDSQIKLPIGPARLARATHSLIVPVTARWGRRHDLQIVIGEPIVPSRNPAETLGAIAAAIEGFVRANFAQWSMLTDLWLDPEPAAPPVPAGHAVADLHLHTPGSDGLCTVDEWLAAGDKAGLRVIAVTDHDHLATIRDWKLRGGDGRERVLPGVELTARGRAVHLGVLFPDAVPTRLPKPGTPLPDLVRWARAIPGAVVVLVHPLPGIWRWQLRRLADLGLLPDAIESRFPFVGGRTDAIERAARDHGLALLGGSDAHMAPGQVGHHVTVFPGETADDLVAAIRDRTTSAVTRPNDAAVPRRAYALQSLSSWLLPFRSLPGVESVRAALNARARAAAVGSPPGGEG